MRLIGNGRVHCVVLPSSVLFRWFANLDFRIFRKPIVGHECNPHSPSGVRGQETAQFPKGQFLVVYGDGRFAINAAIANHATHHVAPWHPLVALLRILDLGTSFGNLHGNMPIVCGQSLLHADYAIVSIEYFMVGHSLDFRANAQIDASDVLVVELNAGDFAPASDNNIVEFCQTGSWGAAFWNPFS